MLVFLLFLSCILIGRVFSSVLAHRAVALLGPEDAGEAKETEALIPGEEGLAGDESHDPALA